MSSAVKAVIDGTDVIFNIQTSKIGHEYPRIFVKVSNSICVNIDLILGAIFPMERKDWDDWMGDAEDINNVGGVENFCKEHSLVYDNIKDMVEKLISFAEKEREVPKLNQF